ncbi:MAG: glycosyltransferase family 4 protein [Candidatus Magasanikbacteria bacterium]|nr:glycosyltransferase family 4 protein [Candidatus Magasanikbacteria bacterium]
MRLLLSADIFPPESGGPATYAVELANGLVAKGVSVTIVSLNPDSDRSALHKKVNLFRVSTRFKPLRYAHFMALLLWYGWKSDVIYAMGPVNVGLPAWWATQVLNFFELRNIFLKQWLKNFVSNVHAKKKFVVKVVGDYAWEQGQVRGIVKDPIDDFQKKQYTGKIGWLQKIERKVVGSADCVIVPSTYLAGMVKGWGAPQGKIEVIYNAVDCKDVRGAVKLATEKWIVSVGRLVPWKGMKTLIEIIPEILEKFPNARLKIIGDGPEMDNLKKCVEDLKLQEVVDLLGNLSHEEALRYIKSADVFILNSGYEGLSHVLLEASYFRVPLYASKSGGNVEVVRDDHLFEYNHKAQIKEHIIHALLSPPETDPQTILLQSEGSLLGACMSREMMIDDTKKILESVCAS